MTVTVEQCDSLDAVERAAAGFLDRAQRPSLFDRLSWYRLIETHAPPPGKLRVLHAHGDGANAWLFLAVDGRIARAFANWYSLRFAAIGGPPAALQALAERLRKAGIARVDLAPLNLTDSLPDAFRRAGWFVRCDAATVSWRIDTRGMSFEDYWATRPSRLRNTTRRKAKAAGLAIEIHREFNAVAWKAYEAVYTASWKAAEGSSAFLRAMAEQEGAAGTLRLGIARKDGTPVAAQLWLVENGVATIHKLAYAEQARDLSPGTILSAEMFRHTLDFDKVDRIDFGTGDDAYKADWMDRSEPLLRMRAFNPSTVAGLVGYGRSCASKLVRRALRH